MALDVSALVDLAALNHRQVTEHRPDPGGEGLRAVDHHEQACAVVQAPLNQVSQQSGHDGLVLGVTEAQPNRDLRAIGSDDKGDHAHLPGEVDAIDHQHRRIQHRQITTQQLIERLLRAGHEPPRHRRLRRRRRRLARL